MRAIFEGGPLDGKEDLDVEEGRLEIHFQQFLGWNPDGTAKFLQHLYYKRNEVLPHAARYVHLDSAVIEPS